VKNRGDAWEYRRGDGDTEQAIWHGRCSPALQTHFHEEHQVTVVLHGIRRFETPDGRIEAAAGKVAVLPAHMPHRPVGLDHATTSINLYLRPRRGAAVVPAAALVLQLPSWMALGTIPDPGKVADWLNLILPDVTSFDAALNEALIASVARAPTSTSAAAAWGLSREGFTRRFARATGMPPAAYRRVLRLNHARALLGAGVAPAAAAAEAGFSDQSHLGRAFRAAFGATPASYRAALGG